VIPTLLIDHIATIFTEVPGPEEEEAEGGATPITIGDALKAMDTVIQYEEEQETSNVEFFDTVATQVEGSHL
jgi:hypothetical protein